MEHIFYDVLPDGSVSVFLFEDWDWFRSYGHLLSYLDSQAGEYQLHDITDTTLDERLAIMGAHK
ncbi:hypothetical protein [Vibrio eleionomae]|uniref:hypothetical protein n=1 Tax=Vibrio eleionomae TaxID=2653505 RepID=UPI0031F3E9AD